MCLVYLSVANVELKYQTKRRSIGLVAVASRDTVNSIKISEFLKPVNEFKN